MRNWKKLLNADTDVYVNILVIKGIHSGCKEFRRCRRACLRVGIPLLFLTPLRKCTAGAYLPRLCSDSPFPLWWNHPGSGGDCVWHGVSRHPFYRAQEGQKVPPPPVSPPASGPEGRGGQGLQCREGGEWLPQGMRREQFASFPGVCLKSIRAWALFWRKPQGGFGTVLPLMSADMCVGKRGGLHPGLQALKKTSDLVGRLVSLWTEAGKGW